MAGRVAHIRQDYDNAARYYVRTIEKGMVNEDLLGKTYIILASQGKIDQAVKYAGIARKMGIKTILSTLLMPFMHLSMVIISLPELL